MDRVIRYAEENGIERYHAWEQPKPFNIPLGLKRNRRWIRGVMKAGRQIIDIGRDPRYRPLGPSVFFTLEQEETADYEYVKAVDPGY
ncbi:MAG: hypothetical protein ACLQVD_20885 [Capsulimonadaceae bacterium]